MNKRIGYVNLDSSTLEALRRACGQGSDLARALAELATGQVDSLMMELNGSGVSPADDTIRCGPLVISPAARRVTRGGVEVTLTPKEFDILHFLARNRGQIFTKEQIYHAVWENEYLLDDSNIMAFIRKLRRKIEPNPDAPEFILTIWGIGYKFNDAI